MGWLDRLDLPIGSPPPAPPEARAAVALWNTMGGAIEWAALPLLLELYAVSDIDTTLTQLVALRDRQAERNASDTAWPSPP